MSYKIPLKIWKELKKDKAFMRKVNKTRKKYGFKAIK
jgi:hypothetical protein